MKTTIFFATCMLLLPLQFVSCESTEESLMSASETEFANEDEQLNVTAFNSNPDSVISNDQTGLILMREEEKMARDVYAFFYEKFKYRIFGNITKSENRHFDAILSLLNYFLITDPSTNTAGTFSNANLQNLYNKFTTEALTVDDALKTGAFIEEYDIADLKKLISETTNSDIKTVYSNLLRGSGFHLKAFTSLLAARGIVYQPTILTTSEFNAIVTK